MHVRAVVSIDEATDAAIVLGFGRPGIRDRPHTVRLSDLIADGGLDEIRLNQRKHSMTKIDHGQAEAQRHGMARSPHWPAVEKAHLKRQPTCVACAHAHTGPVQVHHIFPFHYAIALGRPDLELDDRNLITLCETEAGSPAQNHHILIGHLTNFQWANLDVEQDARETFHGLTAEQIKADPRFAAKTGKRLKPLDQMTADDKAHFVRLMNQRFPLLDSKAA